MGEEATRLENEIRRERADLAGTLQALGSKMSRAANWRYQYAKRPLAGVAAAFAGGIALSKLAANRTPNGEGSHGDGSSRRKHRTAHHGVIAGLRGAMVSALARQASGYVRKSMSRAGSNAKRQRPAFTSESPPGKAAPGT